MPADRAAPGNEVVQEFLSDLASAIRSRSAFPSFPADIDLEQAYEMLPVLAALACDSATRGLKAGLTNPDLQALFGLDEALIGLLYDWGELAPGARLPFRRHTSIECELALVLGADGRPVSLAPAVEFVHLNFSVPEDFSPANLVVSSLGADSYLCGTPLPWGDVDLQTLEQTIIRLYRDGELLQEASAVESLGGPAQAAQWCVEQAQKRGLVWDEGALLLTGTCGSALPAQAGEYSVDYGSLGTISFTIEETPQ